MHPAAGLEPIEGYKLVSRLGAGGYGEVWQATAPGGLSKAVKFVFGSGNDVRTQQELKSLTRIKDVRHPFLLSLDRFELRDGQLIIIMELAERSLQDRFDECRRSGLPGIPRRELLTCISDAADALDYMNENFGLLHLDIKPQNLLLIGGRVKIADFGLVKNLRVGGTITGGITPAYATPEAFDGRASPQSDQYSLAIVYQEMLTGERPFPGATALQLTIQHINSPPLLDALPPADRPIIGKALSKTPADRFPGCRDMVAALISGSMSGPAEPVAPVLRFVPAVQAPPSVDPAVEPHTEDFFRPTVPVTADPPTDSAHSAPSGVEIPDDTSGLGRVRPTAFVGIGGIAALVLKRIKQKVVDRFGTEDAAKLFRFLLLDTDKRSFRVADTDAPAESFFGDEILPIPLKRTEDYRGQSKELLRWLDRRWLFSVPKSQTTEGVRPFGRLAFVDHAEDILARLSKVLGSLGDSTARARQTLVGGMPVDSGPFRVVAVSSLVGGLGSGAVVDLGYAIRQTIAQLRLGARTLGMLAFGTTSKPTERDLARTNAYATLIELKTWLQRDAAYPGDLAHDLLPGAPGTAPFDDCYVHHLGDELSQSQLEAAVGKLAEYLFLDAASTLGNFTNRYRVATGGSLRSFGMNRISVPRFRLAKLTSESFCRHLIVKWCEYPGTREDADLQTVVRNQTSNFGLQPESLATQMEMHVATVFETDSRRKLNALLLERASNESMSVLPNPAEESATKLLQRVHAFLGTGREMLISQTTNRTRFEHDMLQHSEKLATEYCRRATEWVIRWIEDPQERLYVAEKLAREFGSYVGRQSETARAALGVMQDQRETLLRKFADFDDAKVERSWLFAKKKDRHAERMETLLDYFELRLRELAMHGADNVLRSVSSALTDLSQDVLAVRQRLGQYAGGFRASNSSSLFSKGWQSPRPPSLTNLIKGESKSVTELANTILESVMPEALFEFDVMFQKKVLAPAGGLWPNVHRNELSPHVKQALLAETRRAMLDAFKEIDAAQLFLQAFPDDASIQRELAALFDRSRLAILGSKVHLVLAAPPSPSGERLLNEMRRKLGKENNTAAASDGDIIVLFECAGVDPVNAAEKLLGSTAAYAEFARKVLVRNDVAWAPFA